MPTPYEWEAGYQDIQYEIPELNSSPRSPQEAEPMLAPGLPGVDKPDDHTFPHPHSLFMPPQYGPEAPAPAAHPPPLKSRKSDPELATRRPSAQSTQSNSLSSHSSHSKHLFVPSKLNPSTPNYPSTAPQMPPLPASPRRFSSYVTPQLRPMPSEDSRVLSWAPDSTPLPSPPSNRASMILYRMASDDDQLPPPKFHDGRNSRASTISYSGDSKYPTAATMGSERRLIAYAYDPEDDDGAPEIEERLHDPRAKDVLSHDLPWRGFLNLSVLLLLLGAIITLFVGYPVISVLTDDGRSARIVGNTKINSTGQASGEDVPVNRRDQFPIKSSPINKVYELTLPNDDKDFASDSLWRYIAPAATDGAPISHETSGAKSLTLVDIFQLRNPLCLGQGFLEVGFVTGGRPTRLFWDGRWHEQSPLSRVRNTSLDVRISTEDPVSLSSSSSELRYIRVYHAGWSTACKEEPQILRLGTRVRDYNV